jgi:putative hemolysin
VFITEKRKIDDLLKVMQAQKIQMVIVIDEYGQTAGLVALEDILEEIVGNIQDEYDEDSVYIRENGADEYVIQGMMPLDELGKKLGIDFGEEPFDTANGFVISRLEHIPEEDEEFEFEYKGFLFRILEVGDKVIETIAAKKMESQASQNNDGNIVEEVTQK